LRVLTTLYYKVASNLEYSRDFSQHAQLRESSDNSVHDYATLDFHVISFVHFSHGQSAG